MSDYETYKFDVAATSREAERLIEQRIEELRAAALGTPPSVQAPAGASLTEDVRAAARGRAGAQSAPSGTTTLRSAVVDVPSNGQAIPASLDAALSRVEHAVQEDVARIEHMLRTWGSPGSAVGQVGEQVLTALQRVEHGLRRDIAAVLQTVHLAGPGSDDAMIEVFARWTVQLEQQLAAGTGALGQRIAQVGGQLSQLQAAVEAQAVRSAQGPVIDSEAVGEAIADELVETRDLLLAGVDTVEAAAGQVRLQLANEVAALRGDLPVRVAAELDGPLAQLQQRVDSSTRKLGAAISNLHKTVDRIERTIDEEEDGQTRNRSAGRVMLGLTGLRELVEQEAARLSGLGQQLDVRLGQLEQAGADATGAHLSRLGAEIETRIASVTTDLGTHAEAQRSAIEALLGETLAREHEQVIALLDRHEQQVAETIGERHTRLHAELERIEETLLAAQDDVPEELTDRMTAAIDTVQQRIESLQAHVDQHTATVAGSTSEALDSVICLLDDLNDSRAAQAESVRQMTGSQLDDLRELIASELDYNRLQHVRDVELYVDAMSRGWSALFTRFDTTDRRIAKLERAIDVLLEADAETADAAPVD